MVVAGVLGRQAVASNNEALMERARSLLKEAADAGRANRSNDPSQELPGYEAVILAQIGRTDEAIALMRKLWTHENVTFEGNFYSSRSLTLLPRPWQKNGPPIWVGGRSRAALRRAGRLGDGWLVSMASPREVGEGIREIRRSAEEAGREVPDDHYGVLIPFLFDANPKEALEKAAGSIRKRSDISPYEYCALGSPASAREKIAEYAAGALKKGDLLITLGAGDVWKIGEQVVERLKRGLS